MKPVLGISALFHDSAAAVVSSGRVITAAQEERFTRIRHDPALPVRAVEYCLADAGLAPQDLEAIVFYEWPFVKFLDRIMKSHLATWPLSLPAFLEAIPQWMGSKFWSPYDIQRLVDFKAPLKFVGHHESHAASAFFPSPFEEAAILTVDGVGEWSTTAIGRGSGKSMALSQELRFPHSLGLLYSTLTAYLGFKVNSAEYKVMGLAPYGEPTMMDKMRQLVDLKPDGSFRLDMRYFRFHRSLRMPTRAMERLFGQPTRRGEDEPLTQFHKDCARSLQELTNEIMLGLARRAHAAHPSRNLCMAGGVALNCVSNSYILEHGPFDEIFVQPAAGDAGGALGAALLYDARTNTEFERHAMEHVQLGPQFGEADIRAVLEAEGVVGRMLEESELIEQTAQAIADQKIVGWFQGRMEYGPRALGNRSILADPRFPGNRDRVNLAIKFREGFRPFAPSCPVEDASAWFGWDRPSPYMLFTAPGRVPDRIPAVCHVDASARLQTVDARVNPRYHVLHKAFEAITGVPVLINTSFNVRGEPIICTPRDAWNCFVGTNMDMLVMDRFVVDKSDLDERHLRPEHAASFGKD